MRPLLKVAAAATEATAILCSTTAALATTTATSGATACSHYCSGQAARTGCSTLPRQLVATTATEW